MARSPKIPIRNLRTFSQGIVLICLAAQLGITSCSGHSVAGNVEPISAATVVDSGSLSTSENFAPAVNPVLQSSPASISTPTAINTPLSTQSSSPNQPTQAILKYIPSQSVGLSSHEKRLALSGANFTGYASTASPISITLKVRRFGSSSGCGRGF
jgi:hypothetical protein